MKKIIIFFLLIIPFLSPAQPKPEKAPADPDYHISEPEFEEMKQNGVILPPVKPDFNPWNIYSIKEIRDFPVVYDMRNTPWLTPVKGQSPGGCWAYSTMGAVESRLLMLGLGEYNLSDNNLKWCHKYIPERSTYGNHWMSSAYFARRSGPYLESEDPYPGGTNGPDDCPSDLSALYYIHESRYPPSQNIDAIKQSVLDFGPVWSLLYYNSAYLSPDHTYFYGGTHAVNHAGCIIGWNDTLQTAGGTGAWIVRNTYGQSWADNGYYYISYNDSQFMKYNGYWPEAMENEPATTIYQYDEIGGYWGVGFNSETGYGLVKFEGTDRSAAVTKIGTFVVSYGCGVEIKIYDHFQDSLSGLLYAQQEIILNLPGYHTFDLDSAVIISPGEDFYVQVKYDSNDPSNIWPIAIEDTIAGYAKPELETGKFWMAPDPALWPTSWYQTGHNTPYHYDLCIKAYAHELFQIAGILSYGDTAKTPIAGVDLYLKDYNNCLIDSTVTDDSGAYLFAGLRNGIYSIVPGSVPDWGGVNSTDALATELHYLQTPGFTLEALAARAADVNDDGVVDQADAALIQQRTIGIIDSFPAGDMVFEDIPIDVNGEDVNLNIFILFRGDVNASRFLQTPPGRDE
ncbi:MAG: C1 family peptidase [Bacteroidales bacterium]